MGDIKVCDCDWTEQEMPLCGECGQSIRLYRETGVHYAGSHWHPLCIARLLARKLNSYTNVPCDSITITSENHEPS